jgi:predicted kinase
LTIIILICGLPGVGKSSLASKLAPLINAVVLSTDHIRKELFEKPKYTRKEKALVYDVLILIARFLYEAGVNCILDATFNSERSRSEVKTKLRLGNNCIRIIECICPEKIVLDRLKHRRQGYSDADASIYFNMKKFSEPILDEHITVDTCNISKLDMERLINYMVKQ